MNLLNRAQKLPQNTKKLIILILVLLVGIGAGWIWIQLMAKNLGRIEREDIGEALEIQKLKHKLKQAPVPQMEVPGWP